MLCACISENSLRIHFLSPESSPHPCLADWAPAHPGACTPLCSPASLAVSPVKPGHSYYGLCIWPSPFLEGWRLGSHVVHLCRETFLTIQLGRPCFHHNALSSQLFFVERTRLLVSSQLKQMFIEYLLYSRHYVTHWGNSSEKIHNVSFMEKPSGWS